MTDKDQYSIRKFAEKRRKKQQQALWSGDLSILAQPDPHYHVLYNTVPDMTTAFETETLARRHMSRIAEHYDKGEDNDSEVVYYEEGLIQIRRASLPGRTGTFAVMMQVGQCGSALCTPNIVRVHSIN